MLRSVFGAYAAAAVVLVASVVIGLALWRLSGWERASFCAPAAGFAVVLIAVGIAVRLPGRTATGGVVLVLLGLASLVVLASDPYPASPLAMDGIVLALLALAITALPFIATGHFGVLGVGDNNDMSVHMGAAYWLQTHAVQQDVMLVKPGYPLGPHALAGVLGTGLGLSIERSFTGVMLAVPSLAALAAYGGLDRLSRGPRFVGALLTAFAYLAASYLAQAAFKETTEGMLLLAFVLGLREFAGELHWPQARQAVPLGLLAAGMVYVYSYPGVFWPIAVLALVWAAVSLREGPGFFARGAGILRDAIWPIAAGTAAFLIAVAPELNRVIDFTSSHYAHEPGSGLGNLVHPISPAQALGVWLRPDFRFDPDPRWLTIIGLVLAGAALLWAIAAWWREDDVTVPAGLVGAALVWVLATQTKNPYNAAKGLAILSPLVMLLIVSVLLAPRREKHFARPGLERLRLPVALVALGLAATSSFLALRDAPVGPPAKWRELGSFRDRIAGQPTLALLDDDFTLWTLRDAVVARFRNLYTPWLVPLRVEKHWAPGRAVDFDSVEAGVLNRMRYVVTSRSPFASQVPSNFRLVASTPSYELWERTGPTAPRQVLAEGGRPGATLDCTTSEGRALSRKRGVAHVFPEPFVFRPELWVGKVRGAGQSATQSLKLPVGQWDISLQYVSREPLTLEGGGLRARFAGNLARQGPYFSAGTVRSNGRTPITLRATTDKLPSVARLLGAKGNTRALDSLNNQPLGAIAATRHRARGLNVPLRRACGRYVDWYQLG
jgi:hypothetical protein